MFENSPGLRVFGALEKKVLEEVGDAGLARWLVGRADRVPHHVGDDRSTPIGDHHHLQTVVQGEVARLDIQRPGGRMASSSRAKAAPSARSTARQALAAKEWRDTSEHLLRGLTPCSGLLL
jgi:hypothetical protein